MMVFAAGFALTAVSFSVLLIIFFGWVPAILLGESPDIAQSVLLCTQCHGGLSIGSS